MDITKYIPFFNKYEEMGPFERFRVKKVLQYVEGSLIDIGCGFNNLTKLRKNLNYHYSVGVDIHNWYGKPDILCDGRYLPIKNNVTDSISFVSYFFRYSFLTIISNTLDLNKSSI